MVLVLAKERSSLRRCSFVQSTDACGQNPLSSYFLVPGRFSSLQPGIHACAQACSHCVSRRGVGEARVCAPRSPADAGTSRPLWLMGGVFLEDSSASGCLKPSTSCLKSQSTFLFFFSVPDSMCLRRLLVTTCFWLQISWENNSPSAIFFSGSLFLSPGQN